MLCDVFTVSPHVHKPVSFPPADLRGVVTVSPDDILRPVPPLSGQCPRHPQDEVGRVPNQEVLCWRGREGAIWGRGKGDRGKGVGLTLLLLAQLADVTALEQKRFER